MKRKLVLASLLALALGSVAGCSDSEVKVIQKADDKIVKYNTEGSSLPSVIPYVDEDAICIHYFRDDGKYEDWGLWIWSTGNEGKEFPFNYVDDYGGVAYYPRSEFNGASTLGFIVKKLFSVVGEGEWIKDGNSDRFMDVDMLTKDEHRCYNVYLKSGTSSVYTDKERTKLMDAVKTCEFTDSKNIVVEGNNPLKSVVLKKNGSPISGEVVKSDEDRKYVITLADKAEISDIFTCEVTFNSDTAVNKPVSIRKLYDAEFDEKYNYDGELGAIYSAASTTFKVWSPVSQEIKLRLYDNGTPKKVNETKGSDVYAEYPMVKGEKGVFSVTVSGDLQGKYYTYYVVNSSHPEGIEIVDPYAKSAGVNGLRGMVVDFARTNPTGWENVNYLDYDRKALTVYETHIAELTCSSTWGGTEANAKKFKGFYETGTTYSSEGVTVKTGFDHIKELGVNAVQIIPFFDQANDETNMTFNWGYNPLNYNVVEGGYSSDPYDGYARIKELKELIKAYNEAGITIIMDVVYNHVNGLNDSNFDVLAPFYYFRYNDKGVASNGSGCGNETASDKYMFRKFMIDSTAFWTSEYKLGGFRFDLMGIHDVETMNQLTAKNKEINPNIVIYGEPWAGGTTALPAGFDAAVQANAKKYVGYGQFNDHLRDALISGGMSPTYTRAWATSTKYAVSPDDVAKGIKGITAGATDDPNKTVSYVTCHDNYTLNDRVVAADLADYDIKPEDYINEATRKKMNALANSVVFTSQGTSFMLSGEEMLRTKAIHNSDGTVVNAVNANGDTLNIPAISGNSYNSSYKTNEIDYALKIKNYDLFETYQKLVALKKTASGLHATDPNEVEILDEGCTIKVTFKDGDKTYVAYHKNGVGAKNITYGKKDAPSALLSLLPVACSGGESTYKVDTTGYAFYMSSLGSEFNEKSMSLRPFETLILYK